MKIFKWLLRILTACLIAFFAGLVITASYSLSNQTGSKSAAVSETFTTVVSRGVSRIGEHFPVVEEASQKLKSLITRYSPYGDDWNTNMRKLAHFSIYFLIGSLLYLIFSVLKVPRASRWALCIALCMLLACLDELHQGNVAGRAMSGKDVLIDTCGAFCACTVYVLFGKLISWISQD